MNFSQTKSALKHSFPAAAAFYVRLRTFTRKHLWRPNLQTVFRQHFQRQSWGGEETLSGSGSTLVATRALRPALLESLQEYGIHTLLDIPCGDGNWISRARLDEHLDLYIGADIIQELVDLNAARWQGKSKCKFLRLDLTRDSLPRVDLVLCRDGLVHLSNALAIRALKNIKVTGSRYLLATTFPGFPANADIVSGDWRPMNLERPPFSLPLPIKFILERKVPGYGDKGLGLWRINDLPNYRGS